MKTFYSYDTKEYRLMTNVQLVLAIVASLAIIIFGITAAISREKLFMSLAIIISCLIIIILTIPARKKHLARIKNETLVAHDWGIEHQIGEEKREAKWEQISGVDTIDRSFIVYRLKEYVVSVAGDAPIVFYSSLENADFLVNYIKKNLKKRAEDFDVGWVKDSKEKYEDMT